jgi:hypothetical protein
MLAGALVATEAHEHAVAKLRADLDAETVPDSELVADVRKIRIARLHAIVGNKLHRQLETAEVIAAAEEIAADAVAGTDDAGL